MRPRRWYTSFAAPPHGFDAVVREALVSISNGSIDDQAWAQASLPVARSGLGIRSAQHLSVPAFLASIASIAELVSAIHGTPQEDPDRPEALARWRDYNCCFSLSLRLAYSRYVRLG